MPQNFFACSATSSVRVVMWCRSLDVCAIELFGEPLSPREVVQRICDDVRKRGLDAVLHYTSKLDRRDLTPETMRVTPEELASAARQASPEFLETIREIRDNISEFQRAILPQDARIVRSVGNGTVELRQRHLPLKRVGICVPGGAAAYPSTVLMTAVPAMTAGVREIAIVVPPHPLAVTTSISWRPVMKLV